MEDTADNREKYIRFIAQEVKNDGKIPHFDQSAIDEIIREARRRSNRKGHLTLKLRDMGGLIRVAGDIAREEKAEITTAAHVIAAKKTARSIEDQVSAEIHPALAGIRDDGCRRHPLRARQRACGDRE